MIYDDTSIMFLVTNAFYLGILYNLMYNVFVSTLRTGVQGGCYFDISETSAGSLPLSFLSVAG